MALIEDPCLTAEEQHLYDLMSEISERSWYAGWLIGTEFEVWRLAHEGGTWGRGASSELGEDLREIRALSERLQRWIVRPDQPREGCDAESIPLTSWETMYDAWRSTWTSSPGSSGR